jgi:hypothetical protein
MWQQSKIAITSFANMKHYVYIHFKKDTLEPFYIGKGRGYRRKRKSGRNTYWNNIVRKHGFVSDILEYFETHEEALNYEIEMIEFFRREGFQLANLTSGGEGIQNPSQTIRQKLKDNNYITKLLPSEIHTYKGKIYATSIGTSKTYELNGRKELAAFGLIPNKVYDCLNNKRKTHKGYIFSRTLNPDIESTNNYTRIIK